MKKSVTSRKLYVLLVSWALVAACGGSEDSAAGRAVNLTTGEVREFSSTEVPEGWELCADEDETCVEAVACSAPTTAPSGPAPDQTLPAPDPNTVPPRVELEYCHGLSKDQCGVGESADKCALLTIDPNIQAAVEACMASNPPPTPENVPEPSTPEGALCVPKKLN